MRDSSSGFGSSTRGWAVLTGETTPKVSVALPTRSRWLWVALAAIVVLAVVFCFYVTFRGPSEYAGELTRLLPARTSGYAALNDLDAIRRRVAQTRLYEELRNSVDLAALLMTREDWRTYQENKDSLEWKAKAALAREFLRRYFSREVVVALSRLDRCDEPALLVMARTDLGFAEKLGELCAQLYPELRLFRETYRGIPLYAYEAPQSKRSFTYVRFGRTVVLSLRSNERDYLRRIIDWRLDQPTESLFTTDGFRRAWQSPARKEGLLAVCRPSALIGDLAARPEFHLRNYLDDPRRAAMRKALGAFRFAELAATVAERIEIRLVARSAGSTSPSVGTLSPAERKTTDERTERQPLTLLKTVPSSCTAFAVFRFDNLAETIARILNIHRAFGEGISDPRALAKAVERLNAQWGMDINRDLAPALGNETALVVQEAQLPIALVAGLLFPVVDRSRAHTVVDHMIERAYADRTFSAPKEFDQVPGFHSLYPTPFGFLGVGWLGDYCFWGTSPSAYRLMQGMIENRGEAITRNAVFASLGLPIDEPLDAVAFINLEEIGRRAEGLLAVMALLNKNVRQRSGMYGKIIAVAKLLRGVGLTARASDDDWTFVLRVPTQ